MSEITAAFGETVGTQLFALAMGLARIGPAVFFLPYLRPKLIGGGMLRNSLMVLAAIGLAPAYMPRAAELIHEAIVPLFVKEVTIGFLLGFSMGVPFWVAMAVGEYLDNQRGATISSTMDPAVGIKASPFASFFNLFWSATFLMGGGMLLVFQALSESYSRFPPNTIFHLGHPVAMQAVKLLSLTVISGAVIAAPMVIAMYLCELLLGLLSRFASQLNAFSVALSVKSLAMLVVLLIEFGPVIPSKLFDLFDGLSLLNLLERN